MGRLHTELTQILFPNQKGVGIDLGNIEIKESTKQWDRINVCNKDFSAQYILAYSHVRDEWILVSLDDIPKPKKYGKSGMRSITWFYLQRNAIFISHDDIQMLELISEYLDNPKEFIQWG